MLSVRVFLVSNQNYAFLPYATQLDPADARVR